eukprot:926021-Amphidinium_carterae.1
MSPRTRLHLQRLEAEAGVSGFNRDVSGALSTAGPDKRTFWQEVRYRMCRQCPLSLAFFIRAAAAARSFW